MYNFGVSFLALRVILISFSYFSTSNENLYMCLSTYWTAQT